METGDGQAGGSLTMHLFRFKYLCTGDHLYSKHSIKKSTFPRKKLQSSSFPKNHDFLERKSSDGKKKKVLTESSLLSPSRSTVVIYTVSILCQ